MLRRIVPESNPTIITVKTKKIYSTEPYKYFTVEVFNNFAKGELTESLKEALMVHRVKQGRPFRFSAQLYNLSDSKFDLIKEYVVSLDDINNVSPSIIQKHHYVTQEFV